MRLRSWQAQFYWLKALFKDVELSGIAKLNVRRILLIKCNKNHNTDQLNHLYNFYKMNFL